MVNIINILPAKHQHVSIIIVWLCLSIVSRLLALLIISYSLCITIFFISIYQNHVPLPVPLDLISDLLVNSPVLQHWLQTVPKVFSPQCLHPHLASPVLFTTQRSWTLSRDTQSSSLLSVVRWVVFSLWQSCHQTVSHVSLVGTVIELQPRLWWRSSSCSIGFWTHRMSWIMTVLNNEAEEGWWNVAEVKC